MLNEKELDELIQPIVKMQEELTMYVILIIMHRLKELEGMKIGSLEYSTQISKDLNLIAKELSRVAKIQTYNIRQFIKKIGLDTYLDSKVYFEAKGLKFPDFTENKEVLKVLNAVTDNSINAYERMIRTQAFMVRDPKHPTILKPTKASEAYKTTIQEAARKVLDNKIDYRTAMRKTTKQLVDSGLKEVTYEPRSGKIWSQRTDAAVRRNLLDSVRAVNQGIQDEVGKQFGADGKEISVHECSAPDHEPVQGHQFSNEEYDKLQTEEDFQDYQGRTFHAIKRPIGMWNCRHFTFSIVLGVNPPIYSDEELENIKKRNAEGYTDKKGKHHTKYECTQIQRKLEADIRCAKEQQVAARARGDIEEARKWQQKVNELTEEYTNFSRSAGLQPIQSKISVTGYSKISVNSTK